MYPHYHLLPTVKKRLTSGRGSDVKLQSSIEVSNYRCLKKLTTIPTVLTKGERKEIIIIIIISIMITHFLSLSKRKDMHPLIYFILFLIYLFITSGDNL